MNKIFKLFALAMILCVGFFTGCEDINTSNKYESGEKTITISGEYVNEQSGYVAIYVDIPEGISNIYVYRGDMLLGASHYIDYSIFEGQELAVGQHVIKDYYISAGKSYNYTVSFDNPNTNYKSQVLTVTVPEEIEKNNDFSNILATDINLAWDKEHHSFKWTFGEDKDEPQWINMPERNFEIGDNDNSYCYLEINYGVKDNGSYLVSIGSGFWSFTDWFKMCLNENTIGKTFSVSSIIIRCEYPDLGRRAANNEPYCIYCYEKEVPIGSPIGSYPQSISFPSEQEHIAQFEGTWVAPDLETITFNADGSYSTQPSPFTDRTPLNSSGQASVVYDNDYDLSINGYNFMWEKDNFYAGEEMRYDILGMYSSSSYSHITNLVKKQETDIDFINRDIQVFISGDKYSETERLCIIYFNENNECVVRDGSETSELYRGTYSVDGNTVTMKDSNNDVRLTAVVSENGIDNYCYKTDSGEYIVEY
jgi:hypothetical protein